jgi:hypothetical protein
MSLHICSATNTHGGKVVVRMGYDRPLEYIFCTVLSENGEVLYSNLSDANAGTEQQDVEYYRPILKKLGIAVPEEMFSAITADQLQRVGNKVVHHNAASRKE